MKTEQLKQNEFKWIDAKKTLPDVIGVLCYGPSNGVFIGSYIAAYTEEVTEDDGYDDYDMDENETPYYKEGWYTSPTDHYDTFYTVDDVTHWGYLPETPLLSTKKDDKK